LGIAQRRQGNYVKKEEREVKNIKAKLETREGGAPGKETKRKGLTAADRRRNQKIGGGEERAK